MGQSFSIRGETDRRENPETVFVVPGHLNLTLRQMDVILGAGQQPGVPFRLGAEGAQRPQGNKVKVNYAENLVSMQKGTVRLTECVDQCELRASTLLAVSFNYDSLVPAVVRIFVGASDRTVPHQIRAENAVVILGPYPLEAGINKHWSSNSESCFIDEKYFADMPNMRNGVPKPPDLFDLMVCVAPAEMVTRCDLFSIPPGVQNRFSKDIQASWPLPKQQNEKRKGGVNPPGTSEVPPDSDRSMSTISARSFTGTKGGSRQGFNNFDDAGQTYGKDREPSLAVSDFDSDAERVLESKLKRKPTTPDLQPPGGADRGMDLHSLAYPPPQRGGHGKCVPTNVFRVHDYDRLIMVICEMSYVRLLAPKVAQSVHSDASVQNVDAIDNQYNVIKPLDKTSSTIALTEMYDSTSSESPKHYDLKCVMQRVQMSSGVFLTQDIYGMDRNCVEDPEPETVTPGENAGEATTPALPAASTPAGITLDSDAIECVICLTDPRSIAVYPCRHMCLCASCAEVLPSQGNKCPICRRAASMLLKISPKDVVEESSI